MTTPRASVFADLSGALVAGAGSVAAAAWADDVQEVVLSNPNAANDLWYSFGASAVANAAGSIKLAAGVTHTYQTSGAIVISGTGTDKFTCYRRKLS